MNRHPHLIASNANPIGDELPAPPAEINIDPALLRDAPELDGLTVDEPLSDFDRMQDEAELAMHLAHGRYRRSARAAYRE